MKKIVLLFMMIFSISTFTEEEETEKVSFRGTVLYEAKNPIEMSSNMSTIDFGTVVKGAISTVRGHIMTVTGSEGITRSYTLSSEDLGITVSLENQVTTLTADGVDERYYYKYEWDTGKSRIDDLSGHRITFTATYSN